MKLSPYYVALANYLRSIPKSVKTVRTRPIMQDGKCVGTWVGYELGDATIVKEIRDGSRRNHTH
jgi:hypothetical protein